MPVTYLDQEVERLLRERKRVPADWLRLRPKRGHHERDLTLRGDAGSFTSPPSGIRISERGRMRSPNRPTATPTSTAHCAV